MDGTVFVALLVTGLMHAGSNAIVKVDLDRFSSILLIALAPCGIAPLLLPLFRIPAQDSWPWLVGSALPHTGCTLFLIRAYAHGDLAQVYPLARGTAPLIVALIGAPFLGEAVGAPKGLAVAAIALGVVGMSRGSGADLGRMVTSRRAALAPELAIGDGALGFWRALEEVFPTTRHQRSGSTRC